MSKELIIHQYQESKDGWFDYEVNVDHLIRSPVNLKIEHESGSVTFETCWGFKHKLSTGPHFQAISTLDNNHDFQAIIHFGLDGPIYLNEINFETDCLKHWGKFKLQMKIFKIPPKIYLGTLAEDLINRLKITGDDIKLIAADGDVTVKKELLIARSPTFRAMFDYDTEENQLSEIVIKDTTKDVLEEFVHFLETDLIIHKTKNAFELLILGDRYIIPYLKTSSEQIAIKNLSDSNALDLFMLAARYNAPLLKSKSMEIVIKNLRKDDIAAEIFDKLKLSDQELTREVFIEVCKSKQTN